MRRLTSRKPRRSRAPTEEKDIQEEGDGEEIEIPEVEEANGGARPEKNVCKFLLSFVEQNANSR